jgi:hypothetical protein
MLSMIIVVLSTVPPRAMISAVAAATVLSTFIIYWWRRLFDPTAALGPVPPFLELIAFVALSAINIVAAAAIALAFSKSSPVFRFRWIVFGATVTVLLSLCTFAFRSADEANSPQALLGRVVILEQSADRNGWGERQELSTALAFLGRQREAREIPLRPDAVGHTLSVPPEIAVSTPPFVVTPWRVAIKTIAAKHRLVVIMEAHTVSEHRVWIEQSLASFKAAGFTHYCAETIAESSTSLKSRGYPTAKTGFYTRDPRFGNLVRTALRLDFAVSGYDRFERDFNRREEYQATALANLFTSRPDLKMIVHGGHGHVFKHDVRIVGRYMAARLWTKTGVEPFTIWQLSNDLPNDVYETLISQIGPFTEPVMLVPPPRNVTQALFSESSVQPAVDAIVIHPPQIGREPNDRRGPFADSMTRVPGVWHGNSWPILIAAIPVGEPDNAIALDQIMLRRGETEFELWLPRADYTIRAWNLAGPLNVTANTR